MKKTIILLSIAITVVSCQQTSDTSIAGHKHEQSEILNFSNDLFNRDVINSQNTLDSIKLFCDKVIDDTAHAHRRTGAKLYISSSTSSYFRIYENSKGTISAIGFYTNGIKYNVAEYYDNGQVMCKFRVTESGKRNGRYICYHKDGKTRQVGHYHNDHLIADSLKHFEE
jgi:hypothetical protein